MRINYLDGPRLRRALVAGCDFVQRRRAELNRINVFPVPDGDTGTNLALTASAIGDRLRALRARSVAVVAREAADAAILGARGNCGMILSHFLLGFAQGLGDAPSVRAPEFARALEAAVQHVYRSLERPVEGTIITIMRATAEQAQEAQTADFGDLLELLLARAHEALEQTPDLLPVLRKAGVVDAGAKGFVHLLEGARAFVHGQPFLTLEPEPDFQPGEPVAAALADYSSGSEQYRFCTEALVRGADLPVASVVQDALRIHGDSLIVIRGQDVLKVHIHTDYPEQVFTRLREFGHLVTHKAEDMEVQHATVERSVARHVQLARRPVSLVTDSACDLPEEIIRAHGIRVVPMTLVFGDRGLRDGIDIDAATFVQRLRAGERATTSQPPPAAFLEAYRVAGEDGEAVIAIMVGGRLSGTFASAEAAAKRMDGVPVHLFDSRAASLAQGLLVLKACELAELGYGVADILEQLQRIRSRSGILFTVDVFDNLLASGRVGRGQVMIADLLDIKPILGLQSEGTVVPVARVRGRKNVTPRMLREIEERVPRDATVRFGVVHVGCEPVARNVEKKLSQRYAAAEILVAPVTPVLATHLGPGAWGIAYQVE
jgi:fatty acid kinase/fatty acid kinase fatty acid binding subunit